MLFVSLNIVSDGLKLWIVDIIVLVISGLCVVWLYSVLCGFMCVMWLFLVCVIVDSVLSWYSMFV